MEKFKLTELDKFVLLHRANHVITSLADDRYSDTRYPFLSALECDSVKFKTGFFTKKKGALVEVVYNLRGCTVTLCWQYCYVKYHDLFLEQYEFIPKTILIDIPFNGSQLISIFPDPENKFLYIYQSSKSILELCEEGTEEGEADARDGVCHAEAADNTASDVNPYAVYSYHFEDEIEHSVNL